MFRYLINFFARCSEGYARVLTEVYVTLFLFLLGTQQDCLSQLTFLLFYFIFLPFFQLYMSRLLSPRQQILSRTYMWLLQIKAFMKGLCFLYTLLLLLPARQRHQ